MNHVTSDDDGRIIIDSHRGGGDFVALSNYLGIKRTTAYAIAQNYEVIGSIERGYSVRRRNVTNHEIPDIVIRLLDENPLLTLRNYMSMSERLD